jgi:hypothetical protein
MKLVILGLITFSSIPAFAGNIILENEIISNNELTVSQLRNNQSMYSGFGIDFGSQQGPLPVMIGCQAINSSDENAHQQQPLFGSGVYGRVLRPGQALTIRKEIYKCDF